MKRFISLVVVWMVSSLQLFAQEVALTANAPRVVVVGKPFNVEFVLNKGQEPDEFTPPSFDGFEVVANSSHRAQNIVITNNVQTQTATFTYTYVLLPSRDGNLTIGAAGVKVDGKSYSSNPLSVEVVKESGSSEAGETRKGAVAADDILLRILLSKSKVYKGEALVAQIKLYTRVAIAGVEGVKEPAFNGFWKQQLPLDESVGWERETFNGKVYDTRVVGKYLLFPQKSGLLEVEKMDMTVIAQVEMPASQNQSNSVFDSFFGGFSKYTNIPKKVASAAMKVTVENLPAGAPASFDGAVGEFSINGSLSANELTANSSGQLTLQISGKGNMPLINAPTLKLPDTFELYNTKNTDDYKATSSGMMGIKRFEYPFIARAEGTYNLPPVEFSYFDPQAGHYKTLSTKGYPLEVLRDNTPVTGTASPGIVTGVTKEELKILNKDIRFIAVGSHGLRTKDRFFVGSFLYIALMILLVLFFVGMLMYLRKRIKELRDTVRQRNKKANRRARTQLKTAHRYMVQGKENLFYQHMLKGLLGYVGDKLNMPVADLSKDKIRERLLEKGVLSQEVDDLLHILSECEFAQYAPVKGGQMATIYQSSLDLIGRFETKL